MSLLAAMLDRDVTGPPQPANSELDDHSVTGDVNAVLDGTAKHIRAHMRQDHSLRTDLAEMTLQGQPIQVVFDLSLPEIRFGYEEVGFARRRYKRVHPFRIAGVGKRFPVTLQAERERWSAASVLHQKRRDSDTIDNVRCPGVELDHVDLKAPRDVCRARKQDLHCLAQPFPQARRPRHRQRCRPAADQLCVQNKERQAAEMVAVQMRYEDGFDRIRLDAKASNGNHRRGATVNQELGQFSGYVEARVETAAAAKGIATTEELKSH